VKGLDDLLLAIKEKSGSNLPFKDNKNKISSEAKDLLRKLIEYDPKKRISWSNFFNHKFW